MAQDQFLHRAKLAQRAVAATIDERGAGFEPLDAEHVEGEVEREVRRFDEHSVAPVGRPEGKAPLRGTEAGFELANLDKADRSRGACGHEAKAGVRAGLRGSGASW